MARIRWTEKAVADLTAIRDFIGRSSPRYGAIVARRLALSVSQLERNPYSGRIVPELDRPDVRELIRVNYRIVYQLIDDRVVMITVFRGSRAFPDLTAELSPP